MPFPWGLIMKIGAIALPLIVAAISFNLWLGGVKRAEYDRGKEDTIQIMNEEVLRIEAEHEAESKELNDKLLKRNEQYARDIAEITRQALSGAASDRVAIDGDTRRMLNARTARSNSDIEESARGFNTDLPAPADEN